MECDTDQGIRDSVRQVAGEEERCHLHAHVLGQRSCYSGSQPVCGERHRPWRLAQGVPFLSGKVPSNVRSPCHEPPPRSHPDVDGVRRGPGRVRPGRCNSSTTGVGGLSSRYHPRRVARRVQHRAGGDPILAECVALFDNTFETTSDANYNPGARSHETRRS